MIVGAALALVGATAAWRLVEGKKATPDLTTVPTDY